jgi:hypothetical protein
MELSEALENISRVENKFAQEEIAVIREHAAEAIPVLLERIKAVAERGENYEEDESLGIYESYLLAELRVQEAFPYLVSWLDFSDEYIDWLLSDSLLDGFPGILASCARLDDVPRLKSIVTAKGRDWSVRLSALNAITVLYVEGVMEKSDIVSLYGELFATPKEDPEFLAFVLSNAMDAYLEEHFDRIRDLFGTDSIEDEIIDQHYFDSFTATHDEKSAIDGFMVHQHFIRDTVKEMEHWACFHPEKERAFQKKMKEREKQIKRGTKKKYKPKKKKK